MLSNSRLRRKKRELETLETQYDLLSERIKRLRASHAIGTGVAVRFQLEQETKQAEMERRDVEQQIDSLEDEIERLASRGNRQVPHTIPETDISQKPVDEETAMVASNAPAVGMEQFLRVPENRAIARSICLHAIEIFAPEQVRISNRFIDHVLDVLAKGESLTTVANDTAMGLGIADLALKVVASIVVQVSVELWHKSGENRIDAFKAQVQKDAEIKEHLDITKASSIAIIIQDAQGRGDSVEFAGDKDEIQDLAVAISAAFSEYFTDKKIPRATAMSKKSSFSGCRNLNLQVVEIIIAILALLVAIGACFWSDDIVAFFKSEPSCELAITNLNPAKENLSPSETIRVTVTVKDCDESLTYDWSAYNGQVEPSGLTAHSTITYTAPGFVGPDTIEVAVHDVSGRIISGDIQVRVVQGSDQ